MNLKMAKRLRKMLRYIPNSDAKRDQEYHLNKVTGVVWCKEGTPRFMYRRIKNARRLHKNYLTRTASL